MMEDKKEAEEKEKKNREEEEGGREEDHNDEVTRTRRNKDVNMKNVIINKKIIENLFLWHIKTNVMPNLNSICISKN